MTTSYTTKLATFKASKSKHYPITVHIKIPSSSDRSPSYSLHHSPPPSISDSDRITSSMPIDEETPLLWQGNGYSRSSSRERVSLRQREGQLKHVDVSGKHPHAQFCALTGCPPSNAGPKNKVPVPKKSLYGRTVSQLSSQRRAYNASAVLNNLLLLSQVMLGAALTALGASESSHILITCFGALNTVIAGLIAYLKSRGQPMRARMYRDDLERVVDEIENSEVMWRGISEGVHGYDEIDTDEVTVRSEVARLTRLYERAIRLNGMNNPDMYMAGAGAFDGNSSGGGRSNRGGATAVPPAPQNTALPAVTLPAAPQPSAENPGPVIPIVENQDDVAPATKAGVKADKKKDQKDKGTDDSNKQSKDATSNDSSDATASSPPPKPKSESKPEDSPTPKPAPSQPVQPPQPPPPAPPAAVLVDDPDASPATAARLKPKRTRSDNQKSDNHESKKVPGDDES